MAATIFTRLRTSYFTKLIFSSVLSNLILFGAPMQQLVYSYFSTDVQKIASGNSSGNIKEESLLPPQQQTAAALPQGLSHNVENTNFKEATVYYPQESLAVVGIDGITGVENPLDNFFTVVFPQGVDPEQHDVLLSYEIKGVSGAIQTTKRINNNVAYGGLEVTTSSEWQTVSEIVPSSYLQPGRNEIHFNRRENQQYRYSIKALKIELLKKSYKDIQLTNTVWNQNGTIALSVVINNPEIKTIEVLGDIIYAQNGIAEKLLKNVPEATGELKLTYQLGNKKESITVPVTNTQALSLHTFTDVENDISLNSTAKGLLNFSALEISTVSEKISSNAVVKVTGLQFKDVRALNNEIQVVTDGEYKGYRLERQHFADSVGTSLSLKFDPAKIPDGYTEQDVKTFYYDDLQRMWKVLPVDSLDVANHAIRTTTYFNDTDYINGVIKVPDSPETSSFAPTAMSDVKFADPAAGIVSISPPSANNTGAAATNFPLKLPAGRGGMQPSLQVSYSSDAGNSWMGMGWNLSTPSISLNTKWGVPTYNATNESELYALNGSDLLLLNAGDYTNPQKTPNIPRQSQSERQFYERKEGAYNHIVRKGNSPSNYYWVVTDKMGNKSYYGGYTTGVVNNSVIRTGGLTTGNIAHWALYRTEDTNGNYVQYTYSKNTQNVNGVSSQYFYISQIDYTLKGSSNPNFYRVRFNRIDSRQDVTTSARLGLMQLTQSLLSEVRIFYVENNTTENLIRRYSFTYYGSSDASVFSNPFKKSVLKSVAEYDSAGVLFYSHTFEYYNDVTGTNLINNSGPTSWNGDEDNVSPVGVLSGLNLGTEGSALGTSTSVGGTGGIRVGGGLGFNVLSTSATLGGSGSYSYNENNTQISFIDLNGDGLPDKVFKDGNTIKYRPNLGLNNGNGQFGDYITVSGLSSLGKTKTNSVGYGGDLNLGVVGIGKSGSESWSQTDDYFSDFNGDGLPDMVTGGQIKFNGTSGDDTNSRAFTPYSFDTENTITSGQMNPQVLATMDLPTEAELRANYAQFDHVKAWEAPYTGTVRITSGSILLNQPNSCDGTNQFRVTIEWKHLDSNGDWVTSVVSGPNEFSSGSITISPFNWVVSKGDQLYFRIHNKLYGCGGRVRWNPSIAYQSGQSTVYLNANDENGKNVINFSYANDFMLNNGGTTDLGVSPLNLSVNFNLNATTLSALNLTDAIRFRIQVIRYNATGTGQGSLQVNEIRTYTSGGGVSSTPLSISVNNNLPSGARDVLYCFVEGDSNVDWSLIKWKPTYTVSGNPEVRYPGVTYLPFSNNIAQSKYWFSYSEFATPIIDTNTPNDGDTPFMVLSQNFDQVNWQSYLNMSNPNNAENPVRRKVSWLVKKKTATGTTILHKKIFYLNRSGNTYTLSRSSNGSQVLIAGVGDYADYFSKTLTKQDVKDIQDNNANVFTAFYIENELVGGQQGNFNPATITLALHQNFVSVPIYANYTPKELISPFWAQSAGVLGYSYRGWGQFMYNGGINVEDQSDYGLQPITASLFDIDSQSNNAESVGQADPNTSPDDVETMSAGLTVRYSLYQQLNGQNLYTIPLIKYATSSGDVDVTFGPDAQNNLYATMGRFGIGDIYDQYINPNTLGSGNNGTVFAGLKQYSESKGSATSANGGLLGISGSGTLSNGNSKLNNQYVDFNGDRYPDLVTPGAIQFTGMQGGFVQSPQLFNPTVHSSGSRSEERTLGASISGLFPNSTTGDNGVRVFKGTNTQANSGINETNGESKNSNLWLDINGDGLTDRVSLNTDDNRVAVNLNTGYGFSSQEVNWISNLGGMNIGTNSGGSASISGGTAWPSMSFALGLGTAQNTSNTETLFLDVNGDGLPDLVRRNSSSYTYYLNTGTGFSTSSATLYNSATADQDRTISGNFFGSYTWGFAIPIPFLGIAIKATTTPSLSTTAGFSEKRHSFQDIDGDGFIDAVHQSGNNNGSVSANLNTVGKTYLLKKVNTALGGSWSLEYARSTNSYYMPNSKWLLTKVSTHDGFTGDDAYRSTTTLTTIKYEEPNYSRRERESLGYAKVTTEQRNPQGATLFRYVEDHYHNENIYLSGAKKSSGVFDASGNALSFESTLFNLLDPDDPTVNFTASAGNNFLQTTLQGDAEDILDHSRLFIAVARVSSTTYEAQTSLTATKEFVEYDQFGNLEIYRDLGEGEDDAYKSVIEYHPATYFGFQNATGFPKKISVYKNTGTLPLRQREATYYSGTGKLFEIITKLNATENNKVSLEYDSFGNLKKVNDLENKNSANTASFWKEITYETTLNMFPVKIKNSFGEESFMLNYNYYFGMPMVVQDINGQYMRTRIDNRGRVLEVTGPNEMALGANAWTIRMEYKGENAITTDISPSVYVLNAQGTFPAVSPGLATQTNKQHWAVTRHFDPESATGNGTTTTNQMLTITIADGFGQAIQVKKTHKGLSTGTTQTMKWMVSGFDHSDAFGRTDITRLPVKQDLTTSPLNFYNLSNYLAYYAPTSGLATLSETDYDVKDRPVSVLQMGESDEAIMEYSIEGNRFVQKLTNERDQTLDTYTDIRGRQRKTIQNSEITTRFEYNAINELIEVIDNDNFETKYKYDLAGRKIEMAHPDRGVITFKYDKAGRMIERSNSNLIALNQIINYYYDYGRLIRIAYPQNPQNEVKYTYGATTGALAALSGEQHAIGRLLYQEDASGVQLFGYGLMGEVTKNLRSVAVAGYQSYWFYTKWKYDSWNRIKEITYPDQEVVSYHYNEGGALNSIDSQMDGITSLQPIVQEIKYTDYGERASIKHGNNTVTNYSYDARRRMNNLSHAFNNFNIGKAYTYDALSNITKIQTTTPQSSLPANGKLGGPIYHEYTYDNYNRLEHAEGHYTGPNDLSTPYLYTEYSLDMEYNLDHTIKKKTQNQTLGSVASYGGAMSNSRPVEKTSYTLDYGSYGAGQFVTNTNGDPNSPNNYGYQQPHAPRSITETPSWDPNVAQDDPRIRKKKIAYDANGNQTEISETVGALTVSLRKNLWDEENRLKAVNLKPDDATGHPVAIYTYDAGGARTVRYNYDRIDASVNGGEEGQAYKDNVMVYPSGLMMGKAIKIGKRDAAPVSTLAYTKHYYIGSERISAKTGTLEDFGDYPQDILDNAGEMQSLTTGTVQTPTNATLSTAMTEVLSVANNMGAQITLPSPDPITNIIYPYHDPTKLNIYYFHPDHLGSSSYVTNASGVVSQHMEYLPFGETLVDEHLNSNNSPFKYNGKEFDEETGNYYYGARYYDPKWSIFISVDPLADKFIGRSAYEYCFSNPIKLNDPTGMGPEDVTIIGSAAQAAVDDLNKAMNGDITVTKDANGKLDYTLNNKGTLSPEAQEIVNAIDNHSVDIQVTAENTARTSNNHYYVGGAFMGNKVTNKLDASSGKNIVQAFQEVNPFVLGRFGKANGKEGHGMLHEISEAFQGALQAQKTGVSAPDSYQNETTYLAAHNAAIPQPGAVTETQQMFISTTTVLGHQRDNYIDVQPAFPGTMSPFADRVKYESNGVIILEFKP